MSTTCPDCGETVGYGHDYAHKIDCSMVGDKRRSGSVDSALLAQSIGPPDPRGPFFSTQWEREDYERRNRGEPEVGPAT